MLKAGLEQMYHVDQLAVMGFSEVIKHLPLMFNVMGESLGRLRELRPDRIILIDYPGFNLRLAKNCAGLRSSGYVFYFTTTMGMEREENKDIS